jgi:hypothetical protein
MSRPEWHLDLEGPVRRRNSDDLAVGLSYPAERRDDPRPQRRCKSLLKIPEECGQMGFAEVEAWRRRITGWATFNAVATRRPNLALASYPS